MTSRRQKPAERPRSSFDVSGNQSRGVCGYADLLRSGAAGGEAEMAVLAELLGFRLASPRLRPSRPAAEPIKGDEAIVKPQSPIKISSGPLAPASFWRLERRVFLKPVETQAPAPPPKPWAGLPPRRSTARSLAPWRALVPPLRAACTELADGREPDIDKAMRLLARGDLPQFLPRRPRRRWGDNIQIIIDRSERLTPFFDDQDGSSSSLHARLRRLFPRHAVQCAIHHGGTASLLGIGRHGGAVPYKLPEPGSLVIVLGDLGCLARDPAPAMAFWISLGRKLVAAGCRAATLTPCSPAYWQPSIARHWTLIAWDRTGPTGRIGSAQRQARSLDLLRWASPAMRLEPGLLRDLRFLCGSTADAATEADAWQHEALIGRWHAAATFDAAWQKTLRDEFAGLAETAQDEAERSRIARALMLVRDWHGAGLDKHVWLFELLSLHPRMRNILPEPVKVGDLAAAREAIKHLAPALGTFSDGARFYRGVYERAPVAFDHAGDPALQAALQTLYLAAYEGIKDRAAAVADFRPDLHPADGPERDVALRQAGGQVVAQEAGSAPGSGSLLASLRTANGEIAVLAGEPEDDRDAFWASGHAPSWASNCGTDSYGPWVEFRVPARAGSHVTQRMRWIPPGTFQMGSAETEWGRWDDEGPQHNVTISAGFWMFDTPVTQALWQAVMGMNPSQNKDPRRPVENVSLTDAQRFLASANETAWGRGLGLPSEAQWEYACRAETKTATYAGDLSEDAAQHRRVLDDIAWWFGNSEGQTHQVGQKQANAWGLYDTLGNVWEWCADEWHDSYEGAPTDGSARVGVRAAERVVRGGSWILTARRVRAASRLGLAPVFRAGNLGFRCARVQADSRAEQAAVPAGPASRRSAERRRPQGPTRTAVLLRVGEAVPCPAPRSFAFLIRSDREELRFRSLTKPTWASAIGRDQFGLFAEFTIPTTEVTQRLRWIPPGRFRMGSPPDEPGRFDDEDLLHEVAIAAGFWLFDTPVTQALWQAVMNNNPSEFKDPQRPVENVSFDEAQHFLAQANKAPWGRGLVLPSEAQWEYACRAGTETATYAGPIEIRGERNAPVLDPIAWYGGNSGEDFDVAVGRDSSDWLEKQYSHSRAGTRKVAQKVANPWGLYDMLGNVWEWCEDEWHDSYEGAPTDGSARLGGRTAERVVRGGSWNDGARYVRGAYRISLAPDYGHDDLGFRCARVQASGQAGGASDGGDAAQRGAPPTAAGDGAPRQGEAAPVQRARPKTASPSKRK